MVVSLGRITLDIIWGAGPFEPLGKWFHHGHWSSKNFARSNKRRADRRKFIRLSCRTALLNPTEDMELSLKVNAQSYNTERRMKI
ncbi:uncharacterized protein TNCT_39461 [Trichonephila clavata]|uniref:Uncharacterized protein n=2 Tax=Trichonephila TaxID=2585208 RepID=A0A8X6HCP6_TRICU|nr:uncharacterized protein TNCT_39461 [Trichonephila clavata]GFY75986.1 uncharacterized protein TNIN_79911 [Trichonephila inaurata madagascariensis]